MAVDLESVLGALGAKLKYLTSRTLILTFLVTLCMFLGGGRKAEKNKKLEQTHI